MRRSQDDYTEIMEHHFLNPRNVGVIDDPSGVGRVESGECGDLFTLYLRIEGERIVGARFKTFGCAAAIASSSMITCKVEGKTIDEALAIRNVDVSDALGGVPDRKMHCSVLAEQGLHAAIQDYRQRTASE